MRQPTPAELHTEITAGPLAERLAPFWADVFLPPEGPEPDDPAQRSVWQVKRGRAGRLKCDPAHEIATLLRGRCAELGWSEVGEAEVRRAHREG